VRPDLAYWLEVIGVVLLVAGVGCVPLLVVYHLGLRQVSAQGG
jgi:hypothetical protein